MWTRHVVRSLARYCDDELTVAARGRVDAHLAVCPRCRAALEDIRRSARLVRGLNRVVAPAAVWTRIESALAGAHSVNATSMSLRWVVACAILVTSVGGAYWLTRNAGGQPWEVARSDDNGTARLAAGYWLETREGERARILVGSFGTVDVAPDTRIQLGEVSTSGYRLSLARGTINAEINAPPRLFVVDTPASTVVDLGCAYTVTVDENGTGELRMTSGWAALEFGGRESLVPAGAICRTQAGAGPGTPYFEDATPALKQAVDDFDAGSNAAAALETVIRESRVRDTLTLWHLLARVPAEDRLKVYERIAQFEPPPASAPRERVLALDGDALREWREELAWTW